MAAHSSRASVDTADDSTDVTGSAFGAHEHGSSEIQLSASEALPATGRFLGRVVYNTSYALSFGITFPVMMIVRVVPKNNALVHGLVDGALAARDQVYGWHEEMEADHHDEDRDSHGSENGSAHHEDSSGHAAHRRPRAKRAATRKTTRSSRKKG